MANEKWKDVQANIPSVLPLQPPPQNQEQVIPYIQALHNYLADDRLKVARAINIANYFQHVLGRDGELAGMVARDTKTTTTNEDTLYQQIDSAVRSGSPTWEYIRMQASTTDVASSSSTHETLQDYIDVSSSSGVLSGFTLSDAGGYAVAVAAGECLLADSDDPVSREIGFYEYAGGSTAALSDGQTKYVTAYYNAGAVAIRLDDSDDLHEYDAFPLGWVTRESTTLHVTNAPQTVHGNPYRVSHALREVHGFTRANKLGGIIIGNTGTRNPTLSAGEIYYGLNEFSIDAVNCSGADTFTRYYRVAGVWTKQTGLTQWPNDTYTDGTNLLAMTVNRYGNVWWYVDLEDGRLIMLYGTANEPTQSAAEAKPPPATVPERVLRGAVLVGRFVYQKGGAAPVLVQSAFNAAFNAAGATDHTLLSNIGTNTHAQIDTFIGTTVPATYLAKAGGTMSGALSFDVDEDPTIKAVDLIGLTSDEIMRFASDLLVISVDTDIWGDLEVKEFPGGDVAHSLLSSTGDANFCQQGGTIQQNGVDVALSSDLAAYLPLTAGAGAFLSDDLWIKGTTPQLCLNESGTAGDYSTITDNATGLYLQKIAATGASVVYINPYSTDNTSESVIRLFRGTNTTGARYLTLYLGDGSGTVQHNFNMGTGDVDLCQQGGEVTIGGTAGTQMLTLVAGDVGLDAGRAIRGKTPAGGYVNMLLTESGAYRVLVGNTGTRTVLRSVDAVLSKVPTSALSDANHDASTFSTWVDESAHTLNFKVKYSGGTVKSGSIALA